MSERIHLTDQPPVPTDDRCPDCGAGREHRVPSQTYGPRHDVCGWCGHDYDEWTVPDISESA